MNTDQQIAQFLISLTNEMKDELIYQAYMLRFDENKKEVLKELKKECENLSRAFDIKIKN